MESWLLGQMLKTPHSKSQLRNPTMRALRSLSGPQCMPLLFYMLSEQTLNASNPVNAWSITE
jgi:hypothetical protein